ncbi:MAG TPA: LuxR C-terminal-related transcriptional regulator [Solirubrobacteraceae bacterium]|nr:LuxR C-terminal-related transcriptional regulator [Solirubrobacteraceae bacterium]
MTVTGARVGSGAAHAWPLIGRDAELEQIATARASAACPAVAVIAPAGVGKSRLAREAVAAAADAGAMVCWVQGTRSAAAVPLAACTELLPPDARADDPLLQLQRTARTLREHAAGRPIVIGVDDAQRLDPASAALILQLALTGTAFVLATVRSSEPCPDAVESLWKDAGAARLELQPLSEASTSELVEAVLEGPVEQRARDLIYDGSQGNVLYTHELVMAALEMDAFVSVDGYWRLTGRPVPSASLIELVGGRLSVLDDDERHVIELLALGEPLRLRELVSLAGAQATASVEAHGMTTVEGIGEAGTIRLAHPLYGDVVRSSMPVIRAAQTRRDLARTVQRRPDRSREDALLVARWLLDAGDGVPADLMLEGAAAAIAAGDPEFGERLARLALDEDGGLAAALLVARACAVRQRYEEAEAVLAPFEGGCQTQEIGVAYLQQRVVGLLWGLRRPQDGMDLVTRALGWWDDPGWRRRLAPLRVRGLAMTGDSRTAAELSGQVLADEALEPQVRRQVEVVHAVHLFGAGRARRACELLIKLRPPIPLRDEVDELSMIASSVTGIESGWEIDEVERWMGRVLREAIRTYDEAAAGISANTLGALCLLRGRFVDAARWLREALVHQEYHDPFRTLKCSYALLAGVAYYTGDRDGVAAAMERCRAAITGDLIDQERAYVVRGEAWLALAHGDPPRAQQMLLERADGYGKVPLYAAQLYHEAMRAGAPARRVHPPLAALRERCDARLVLAYADDAAARAEGDGTAMLACADEFEAIGALRHASECAAVAAETFIEAGRQDSARRAAARSRELHGLCQGGSPPEVRGLEPDSYSLTERERQLVELAAQGLSNAEIADRFVLSVRTVESHLYRAMQKLGVKDRRDLRVGPEARP